jgi:hypothetical protein
VGVACCASGVRILGVTAVATLCTTVLHVSGFQGLVRLPSWSSSDQLQHNQGLCGLYSKVPSLL